MFTNAQGAYWVRCIIGAMQELWDLIYGVKKMQNVKDIKIEIEFDVHIFFI